MAKEKTTKKEDKTPLEIYKENILSIFGKNSGVLIEDPNEIKLERFSTGSYLLDRDMKGGWVKGTMIEIYGAEASSKTTLCIHAVAEHQKKYPDEVILWVDLEKVFDPIYFSTIGVNFDPEKFILLRPSSGEETWDSIINFAKTFQNGVVVLDSVATLLPKSEDEGSMDDAAFALAARMNSKGLRKLFPYVKFEGTTFFMVNQVREDIGAYGDSDKSTGGNGFKFFSRCRIKTSKSKGEPGSSATIKYRQVKSTYGNPDRITETAVLYGIGFDRTRELLRVAVMEKIVEKTGGWYSYNGDKYQGEDNVVDLLNDNPELLQEIETKINEL